MPDAHGNGVQVHSVAIKTPSDGRNYEHQKALLDELKIMLYLGRHVNVLGFVGYVTEHMVGQ